MPMNLSDKNFEEAVMKSDRRVVVMFSKPACDCCTKMYPLFEEISMDVDEMTFFKVDGQEFPTLLERYKITSAPYFLVVEHGKILRRFQGVKSREAFLHFIYHPESRDLSLPLKRGVMALMMLFFIGSTALADPALTTKTTDAIQVATNNLLVTATNSFDPTNSAHNATNSYPWGSLYDAAGTALAATNGLWTATSNLVQSATNGFGGGVTLTSVTNVVTNLVQIATNNFGNSIPVSLTNAANQFTGTFTGIGTGLNLSVTNATNINVIVTNCCTTSTNFTNIVLTWTPASSGVYELHRSFNSLTNVGGCIFYPTLIYTDWNGVIHTNDTDHIINIDHYASVLSVAALFDGMEWVISPVNIDTPGNVPMTSYPFEVLGGTTVTYEIRSTMDASGAWGKYNDGEFLIQLK
jgi:thioredoxin 1